MVVIIRSPNLTHKSIADSEVFCFNHDRLKIAFKVYSMSSPVKGMMSY